MNEFLQRLRQRKLVQWALAYVAAAFALLQGIDIVAQRFGWPEQTMRFVIIALSVGFFVTLVLAWYHGERGAQRVAGTELLILALLLGLGGGFLWRFASTPRGSAARSDSAGDGPRDAASLSEKFSPPTGIAPEKSIAVLPFENLSEEKANAFFASGIQDEILTRLAKISDLKVISRTSTQQYQSKPESLSLIAQQLGVANILEGSVQKAGDAVHINVQLIKAATDAHLWAESYDRELKNIFAVEGEVAGAIADALKARLTGEEKKAIADKPTQNTAAYDAYLRGLTREHSEYSYTAYQQVARDYAEAVQLDPKFALAWARLAVIRSFLYFNSIALDTNTPTAVKEAADRALALAPEAGESWTALGAYRYRVLRDFSGALEAYGQAQQLLPNSSLALLYMAYVDRRLGRWEEAEARYKKVMELDPRNVQTFNSIGGEFYNLLRRFDDARAALNRALEISPDSETTRANLAAVFQSEGRLAESAQQLAAIPMDSTDDWVINNRVIQTFYERQFDAAIQIIERKVATLVPGQPLDSYTNLALVNLGYAQEWLGRAEEAKRSFTRAIQEMKPTPDKVVLPDANGTPATLALAYAGLHQKEQALEQAKRAVTDYANDAVARPPAEVILAQIQARFGDLDSAMAALPHLLSVPAGITVSDLQLNPMWDPLRNDPRFQALLKSPGAGGKDAGR